MPLGKASRAKLQLCPPELQRLFEAVAEDVDAGALSPIVQDITIVCTFRDKAEQNAAYYAKPQRSKKLWPNSGHNKQPPRAVDAVPYPLEWEDNRQELLLQGYVRAKARAMGIRLKPIISWDVPHYELADE